MGIQYFPCGNDSAESALLDSTKGPAVDIQPPPLSAMEYPARQPDATAGGSGPALAEGCGGNMAWCCLPCDSLPSTACDGGCCDGVDCGSCDCNCSC